MSLVKTWAPYFQPSSRMRGRGYYLSGRVRRVPPENGELVRAVVRGRREYLVTISGDGNNVSVHCTCPRFAEGLYCKHIWATILDVHHHARDLAQQVAGAAAPQPARPHPLKARKREHDTQSTVTEPARNWLDRLNLIRPPKLSLESASLPLALHQRLLHYLVRPELCDRHMALVVELRQVGAETGSTIPTPLRISAENLSALQGPDRETCALLLGSLPLQEDDSDKRPTRDRAYSLFRLLPGAQRALLRSMIATGRCFVKIDGGGQEPLAWDDGPPWCLRLKGEWRGDVLQVDLVLARDEETLDVRQPLVVTGGHDGLVIHAGQAAAFDDADAFRWVTHFRDYLYAGDAHGLLIPRADVPGFLDRLYLMPALPALQMPPDIARPEQHFPLVPHLELTTPPPATPATPAAPDAEPASPAQFRGQVNARVSFVYGPHRVRAGQLGPFVFVPDASTAPDTGSNSHANGHAQSSPPAVVRRDRRAEADRLAALPSLGFRTAGAASDLLVIPARQVPSAVGRLVADGWVVTADQQVIRSASRPHLAVTSGIDWFELRGELQFATDTGNQSVSLPDVLAAARNGQTMIRLTDGTWGLLPEQWLRQVGLLAAVAKCEADHLRFKPSQAPLLDALLTRAADELQADQRFLEARRRARQFQSIQPLHEGSSFRGELRVYQRDGLGWLDFLRWFGMGGILADDMGLGKTVQVLAMLERLYCPQPPQPPAAPPPPEAAPLLPSLIVVPRSVIFNWLDEAARFTPHLRVQAYTGSDRAALRSAFHDQHVIITSYGLLRRDADALYEHEFEYVILDEAQAIKNPTSLGAKAARLLRARHRLALTGTPVENHLGDLWSIFEFLNPGMLGASSRFSDFARSTNGKDAAAQRELAQQASVALRPFILRRTKAQVLSELPDKTEQTLLCEMEPEQRRVYDDLLKYYRSLLLASPSASGGSASTGRNGWELGGSAMAVIEALLRLRQAACHPALIDPARENLPSAKIDVLLEQLTELIEEGHKALVFSQFTSLLALVRKRMDAEGILYEYLDGQTRDRKKPVQRFQQDPACPVFLISLKAGGLGLNLTAADYVFILDPWWNPAVEQQAVDRAHRIGQTRHVFAYRLICENTVEQRIAELQSRKKELAEAILGGQDNLLRSLTRDDLEHLLS